MTLAGKAFVITGFLPTLSRQDAFNLIKFNGGEVSSSVTKKTNYLVAGSHPGSKYEKAQRYGIPIIDETHLLKLINEETES